MDVLRLIIFGLLSPVASVILILLFRKTKLGKINYWVKQVLIGLLFGGFCVLSTEFGFSFNGAVLNARTSIVCASSFVFGWPAGLITAFIGSLERGLSIIWNPARNYTEIACTVATATAGLVSAAFKGFKFKDKLPGPLEGTALALVIEVFHMLLVFLTNMNDVSTAVIFVKNVSTQMILVNTLSTLLTIVASGITLYALKVDYILNWKQKHISSSVQKRLLLVAAGAFILSMILSFFIEQNLAFSKADDTISSNIEDIENEISYKSDNVILTVSDSTAKQINNDKPEYINWTGNLPDDYTIFPQLVDLHNYAVTLAYKLNVSELNLVNSNGIIYASTNDKCYKYDMNSGEQSKYFNQLLENNDTKHVVQQFMPQSIDQSNYMKYAATRIYKNNKQQGYVQIGYNSSSYYSIINALVKDSTTYRKVGTTGRLMIAMYDEEIISDRNEENVGKLLKDPTVLGIDISSKEQNILFACNYNNSTPIRLKYQNVQGYYIVGTMEDSEVMLERNTMLYVISFSEVIIFAVLIICINLVNRFLIIKRLEKVNEELEEITSGNLDVVVDVTDNVEFETLSNDINTTVDALKRNIEEASRRIDEELKFASTIQLSSLPTPLETQRGCDLYATIKTAKEVGGDFYDFYYIDKTHLLILVADVSGKGIPAAMFMMKSKSIIKGLAHKGMHADDIITLANNEICLDNKAGMFVTAWMGIIDTSTGHVEYVNAGHNPPLIGFQEKHDFDYLNEKPNMVLGAFEGFKYTRGEIDLDVNQTIFLYTDGVTEATNVNKELYGETRLKNFINNNIGITNKMLINNVNDDVKAFVGEAPQFDDITMLAYTYLRDAEVFKLDITSAQCDFDRAFAFISKRLDGVIDSAQINKLLIAMDEMLSNISKYGYKDKIGPVTIILTNFDNKIKITIIDESEEYNPLEAAEPDISLSADERQIGGLGIFMVKKLMDDVSYHYQNHSNILVLTLNVNKNSI